MDRLQRCQLSNHSADGIMFTSVVEVDNNNIPTTRLNQPRPIVISITIRIKPSTLDEEVHWQLASLLRITRRIDIHKKTVLALIVRNRRYAGGQASWSKRIRINHTILFQWWLRCAESQVSGWRSGVSYAKPLSDAVLESDSVRMINIAWSRKRKRAMGIGRLVRKAGMLIGILS